MTVTKKIYTKPSLKKQQALPSVTAAGPGTGGPPPKVS